MSTNIFLLILSLMGASTLMGQRIDSLPPHVYKWDSLVPTREESYIRRSIMEGGTTSLADFEVHASTIPAGEAPHPPHTHQDQEELIIVKEGLVKITIKDTSKVMGPGSIAFILTGDEHKIENAGNTSATYYVFKYRSGLPVYTERARQNGGSFMINRDEVPVEGTEKGNRRAFFNKATSQLEKLEMHTTSLNPGLDSHAPHTHKEEEIILIIKGNVQMFIAGSLYKAAPGDVIFLSSGVLHALKNTGSGQCEYFAFQWRN